MKAFNLFMFILLGSITLSSYADNSDYQLSWQIDNLYGEYDTFTHMDLDLAFTPRHLVVAGTLQSNYGEWEAVDGTCYAERNGIICDIQQGHNALKLTLNDNLNGSIELIDRYGYSSVTDLTLRHIR